MNTEGREGMIDDIMQVMLAELEPHALISQTLQRLMHYTGSDCGTYFSYYAEGKNTAKNLLSSQPLVRLDAVLGAKDTAQYREKILITAPESVFTEASFFKTATLWPDLQVVFDDYPCALVLPDSTRSFFILFFNQLPAKHVFFEEVFNTSLRCFARLLQLCRLNKMSAKSIGEENSIYVRHKKQPVARLLEQRTDELRRARNELKSFEAAIAHEFRAPLRSIAGFNRILIEDCSDQLDAGGRDCLLRVHNASQSIEAMIKKLAELAKITTLELKRCDVNLSILAVRVLNQLIALSPSREVKWDIEENMMHSADESLMELVLSNLFSNALKFSRHKKVIKIKFGCRDEDGEKVYFVSDNGAGFDMQFSDKLFKPFSCLHAENDAAGSGVGLAVVQRIIHRHGGRIWAYSDPDKKTEFLFTLNYFYTG